MSTYIDKSNDEEDTEFDEEMFDMDISYSESHIYGLINDLKKLKKENGDY